MRRTYPTASGRRVRRAVISVFTAAALAFLLCGVCCGRLCAVRVDGELVGYLRDGGELGEALSDLLSAKSAPDTVSAYFRQEVSAEYGLAPVWRESSFDEIASELRERLEVVTVNEDTSIQAVRVEDGIVYRG